MTFLELIQRDLLAFCELRVVSDSRPKVEVKLSVTISFRTKRLHHRNARIFFKLNSW